MADVEGAFEAHHTSQRESDRLRGALIRMLNSEESTLDGVITEFFASDHEQEFRPWLLARLSLMAKIDITTDILKSLGLHEEFRESLTLLKQASEHRNFLAHSFDTIDMRWLRRDMALRDAIEGVKAAAPTTVSLQRRGGVRPRHDDETTALVDRLEALWPTMFELLFVVTHATSADDASRVLAEFRDVWRSVTE